MRFGIVCIQLFALVVNCAVFGSTISNSLGTPYSEKISDRRLRVETKGKKDIIDKTVQWVNRSPAENIAALKNIIAESEKSTVTSLRSAISSSSDRITSDDEAGKLMHQLWTDFQHQYVSIAEHKETFADVKSDEKALIKSMFWAFAQSDENRLREVLKLVEYVERKYP